MEPCNLPDAINQQDLHGIGVAEKCLVEALDVLLLPQRFEARAEGRHKLALPLRFGDALDHRFELFGRRDALPGDVDQGPLRCSQCATAAR